MKLKNIAGIAALLFSTLAAARATNTTLTFQPGHLAVLRAGDGFTDLAGKQAPIFVDQYDTNGANNGTGPSVTVAIPTNGTPSWPSTTCPLFFNGQAATEGNMTRSADRTVITWSGYAAPVNNFGGTPSGLGIDRGICTIDAFTNYNVPYEGQNWFGGLTSGKTNPRGIATDGTNNFWGSGGTFGVKYFDGSDDPYQIEPLASTRDIRILNGKLYTSINAGDAGVNGGYYYPAGVYSFEDFYNNPVDLPTAFSGLKLEIQAQAPYTAIVSFEINPQGTVAYVTDTAQGVQKYTKSGGAWQFAYNFSIPQNIPANLNNANGCYGLAVDWSGPVPVIYATTTEGYGGNVNSNRVVSIVDTGSGSAVTTVAQSPSIQKVFRGLALTPDLRPVITAEPVSYSGVIGSNATFNVSASSVYAVGYQWYSNSVPLTSSNEFTGTGTSSLIISNAQAQDAASYFVVVTNVYGAVTSTPASLTLSTTNVPPALSSGEQFLTNVIGDNVTITVPATGTDPKTYRWYTNGVALADANEFTGSATASLSIANAQINDATTYSCAITNLAGGRVFTVAQLTLIYNPPGIISQPVSTTALLGSPASFSVLGYGGGLTYQWYGVTNWVVSSTNISYTLSSTLKVSPVTNITYVTNGITTAVANAGDITGAGTAMLNFSGAQFVDTNVSYFAVITNVGGAITSSVVTLSVLQQAPPSVVSYTNAQQIYLQNFDSLPIPSAATVNTANPATITVVTNTSSGKTASYTYSLGLTNYDFAAPIVPVGNVGGLGLSAMSGWYGWAGIANKLGASAGDQSTGGQVSEGAAYNTPVTFGMTNRALGLLSTSSTGPTAFGVKIINNSGTTLSNFCVHYLAELWRQQPSQQPINVGYYVDAVGTNSVMAASVDGNGNLITGTVNWVPGLTAAFPTGAFVTGGLDGTQPANQMSMDAYNLPVTNWAPNTALWFVFCMTNDTGSHQGLAVDNFTFAANTNVFAASAKPVVTNLTSSVVANGATLYGLVCPNGLQTSYYFQYGATSNSYTGFTATNLMAAGPFTNAVTATISSLAAGVTNYYQLVASNIVGSVTNTGVFSYITPSGPSVTISNATAVTQLSATLNGGVNANNAATTYYFNWGTSPTALTVQLTPTVVLNSSLAAVNASIKAGAGLAPNTTYYYDLVAYNGVGLAVTSSVSSFTTSATAAPLVYTLAASGITTTNATFNGAVNQGGLAASYWFQYGPTASYGYYTVTNVLATAAGSNAFSFAMTGLSPNTTNYYQAWASTTLGTNSGAGMSFTTLALAPTNVLTLAATGITGQGAVFNAQINPNGVTNAYWFQYGTTTSYGSVSTTNYTPASTSTLLFTNLNVGMAALTPNTTYHYQVIDVNNGGSTNGGDMTFTTLSVTVPTVTTLAASNITASAGTLDASVNPNNSATAYWFKYGTNITTGFTNLTATNSLAAAAGLSNVTNNISGLLPGTTYYFAAVATNSAGTSLGVTNSFATLVPVPTVVTLLASNITGSAGTLDASVNPNNGATAYWFVYGTNNTTGLTNLTATNNLAAGYNASIVTNLLSGLLPVTTYYFSAVATNSGGTSVGVTNSFITLPGAPDHLIFGQQPGTTTAGVAISPSVTVIIKDAYGNTVTSDSSSVTIASANTAFTGGSTLAVNAIAGVATFSNLKPTTAGALRTLAANDVADSLAFVNSSPFTVGVASPSQLAITTQPAAPAVNGGALATQPVVVIEDQYNNVVTTATSNIVAQVGAGIWTIGGTATQAAASGTATFAGLTATSAAAVTGATISFTSSTLTGVTSTAFNIPAPIASSLGGAKLSGGQFIFNFTNTPGLTISVFGTNNLTVPRSSWPVIGTAVENPTGSGNYQFTNGPATNGQQFYYTQP
jgi:hypothetical protein